MPLLRSDDPLFAHTTDIPRNTTCRRRVVGPVAALVLTLVALSCGGGATPADDDGDGRADPPRATPPADVQALRQLGEPEGRLVLIGDPRYVQDGASGTGVDWVSAFEASSGCEVRLRPAESSRDLSRLVRSQRFDAVAAPGDVSLGLIADGLVAPVNTRLVPSYADVVEGLRDREFNSAGGRPYGVPQGRSANVLLWRKDRIPGSLTSWSAVFDPAQMQPYRGKVTARDDPMTIATAAVWLKARRKELGIVDPYALDERQFRAALELLRSQRRYVGQYWANESQARAAFARADAVMGQASEQIADTLRGSARPVAVETILGREGATGSATTWMVSSKARHPVCAYRWMEHVLSPRVNARIAEFTGEAPASRRACEFTRDEEYCDAAHAEDEGYFERVAFHATPTRECGDDRGAVCKDYADWVRAWRALVRQR